MILSCLTSWIFCCLSMGQNPIYHKSFYFLTCCEDSRKVTPFHGVVSLRCVLKSESNGAAPSLCELDMSVSPGQVWSKVCDHIHRMPFKGTTCIPAFSQWKGTLSSEFRVSPVDATLWSSSSCRYWKNNARRPINATVETNKQASLARGVGLFLSQIIGE